MNPRLQLCNDGFDAAGCLGIKLARGEKAKTYQIISAMT